MKRALHSYLLIILLLQGVVLSLAVLHNPEVTTENMMVYTLLFGSQGQAMDTCNGAPVEEKVVESINFFASPHHQNPLLASGNLASENFSVDAFPILQLSRKVISPPPEY